VGEKKVLDLQEGWGGPGDAAAVKMPAAGRLHSPPQTPHTKLVRPPHSSRRSYYRRDGSNRMSDLGYKESERDRTFRPYTWEHAYRFSNALAVRFRADRCFLRVDFEGWGWACG